MLGRMSNETLPNVRHFFANETDKNERFNMTIGVIVQLPNRSYN